MIWTAALPRPAGNCASSIAWETLRSTWPWFRLPKDEYNSASPQEDPAGRFAGDIVATLHALGTSDANIGILAGVAVTKGDYLHLNLTTANSGPGGGNNALAAFPNGRRLGDDTIDTLMSIITNGAIMAGDHVNANDVLLRDTFPFFALSQQPRDSGVIDDNTRN